MFKEFPPAIINSGATNANTPASRDSRYHFNLNTTAWTMMLPYLDEAPLYNQYNFNAPSSPVNTNGLGFLTSSPIVPPENTATVETILPILLCASEPFKLYKANHDGSESWKTGYKVQENYTGKVACTSYMLAGGRMVTNWGFYTVRETSLIDMPVNTGRLRVPIPGDLGQQPVLQHRRNHRRFQQHDPVR